jgi:hypothetical protein
MLLDDEIADGRNWRVRKHAKVTRPAVEAHYAMVLTMLGLPVPTATEPVSAPGNAHCEEGASAHAA